MAAVSLSSARAAVRRLRTVRFCSVMLRFVFAYQLLLLHTFMRRNNREVQRAIQAASAAGSGVLLVLLNNSTAEGRSEAPPPASPSAAPAVDWKVFHGRADADHVTVSGEPLPGHFWNKRLYLLGGRLTTSYEEHVHDVHFDLFGLPLQWFDKPAHGGGTDPRCLQDPHSLRDRGIQWDFERTHSEMKLFCQIECRNDACHTLVPMEHLPMLSLDWNQDESMHIWRCPVPSVLTKADLVARGRFSQRGADEAVRFHVWALEAPNTTAGAGTTNITTDPARPELVASMDIPLSTAVLGMAGPQIRTSLGDDAESSAMRNTTPSRMAPSYFAQEPIAASLVLALHGTDALRRIPEFVQHHRNLGFGSIIIALDHVADSKPVVAVRKMLGPLIDEGIVAILASGTPDLECDTDLKKLLAYHMCLFHNKGLAEYQAVWDVDEYWLPPLRDVNATYQSTELDRASVPRAVRDDELWRQSKYASSFSVNDVLTSIAKYRAQRGCDAAQWCYHLFPSYTVHLKRHLTGEEDRGAFIAHDFDQRQVTHNIVWHKGIAKTKYTHMSGFHHPGTCRFNNTAAFTKDVDRDGCRALDFEQDPVMFGAMHHFASLLSYREFFFLNYRMQTEDEWPVDEYVQDFGKTVEDQLARARL